MKLRLKLRCESWTVKKAGCRRIDAFELWYWRGLLRVLGLQEDPTSPFWRWSALGFLWREWCWSWNSSTLATSCEELTHWERLWCWEGLGAGGEGDYRGWDGWMASLIRWMWVWVNSRSWWWTGRHVVLQFMGSQRVGHDWVTELNWTETNLTLCRWASSMVLFKIRSTIMQLCLTRSSETNSQSKALHTEYFICIHYVPLQQTEWMLHIKVLLF